MIEFGILSWIIASCGLAMMTVMLFAGRRSQVDERVSLLAPKNASRFESTKIGETVLSVQLSRRLEADKKKQELRNRLMQAGFYGPNSAQWLLAFRFASFIVPLVLAWVVAEATSYPLANALMLASIVGAIGMIAPSFILDAKKKARQQRIRRSLPDAMDILNVCLEGGISLPSSFARVSQELVSAHPELALELAIVDRETRMGRTVAESLRSFADRFDLEELRSMASVIAQAEKYGASVATAIDVFAESMRLKRMLQAETKAQQAVVKVIFPTLLCIFPVLFIVIMGPVVIRIHDALYVNAPVK